MSCETKKKSVGLSECNEWPSQIKTGIWTPNDFVIPAATAASPVLLKAFMQAALITTTESSRIYQYPIMDKVTDVSEAKVRVQQSSGRTIPVREGLKRFDIEWSINICLHRAMFTHRTRTGRWIIVDFNDDYVFTKNTDGDFSGFKVSLFDTDSIKFNTGSEPSISPAFLELANPNELNQNGYMTDASFTDELDILTDVTVTEVTGTTTVITVDVKQTCDATPVLGLVTANFLVKKTSDGSTQTVVAAAVSATPGRYTLTGTALATGTIAILSTSNYEALATAFTVPFP
jgi:hypothetical protein